MRLRPKRRQVRERFKTARARIAAGPSSILRAIGPADYCNLSGSMSSSDHGRDGQQRYEQTQHPFGKRRNRGCAGRCGHDGIDGEVVDDESVVIHSGVRTLLYAKAKRITGAVEDGTDMVRADSPREISVVQDR